MNSKDARASTAVGVVSCQQCGGDEHDPEENVEQVIARAKFEHTGENFEEARVSCHASHFGCARTAQQKAY